MKYFEHESAATFDEAVSLLKESPKGKTVVMEGGNQKKTTIQGAPT